MTVDIQKLYDQIHYMHELTINQLQEILELRNENRILREKLDGKLLNEREKQLVSTATRFLEDSRKQPRLILGLPETKQTEKDLKLSRT